MIAAKPPINRRLSYGFTLIEVLIAMTLLSVMMTLLFGAMRICADSWEKGESKVADVSEIAAVYSFFQRHLRTAIPLSDGLSADPNFGETFAFQGEANKMQFVSSFPASVGQSGLQLITLQVEHDDDAGQKLTATLTPFYPAALGSDWETEKRDSEVDVIQHVRSFELHYFGPDDIGSEPYWQDKWSDKEFHPRLVKISIVLEDKKGNKKDGIFWPDMVIDLKATQTAVNSGFTFDAPE